MKKVCNLAREKGPNFVILLVLAGIIGIMFFYLPIFILLAIATKLSLVSIDFFSLVGDSRVMVIFGLAFGLGAAFTRRNDIERGLWR